MTITTLDPITALIVIDLQRGIVDIPSAHPLEDIIERSTTLARAFRERGLPVVLVNVAGAPGPHRAGLTARRRVPRRLDRPPVGPRTAARRSTDHQVHRR
jgi:nicotinamidase-related amidase